MRQSVQLCDWPVRQKEIEKAAAESHRRMAGVCAFETARATSRIDGRSPEVWRGDVRLSMSVSAPFVWRCLSGSAVAPFPHPAHRTGRADLSGSSAIAGFRPHGSHRAALPQWALQKGPEAGRSVQPCLVDRRFREGKGGQELAVGRPVHAALLAAFAERLAPVPGDAFLEHAQ